MRATDIDAIRFMRRLSDEGIKPHRSTIAPIITSGGIAVVVFEPFPQAAVVARGLGWDGKTSAFRMTDRQQRSIALSVLAIGDHVSHRWFTARRNGRIFVIVHEATLLVNVMVDGSFELEAGSKMHNPPPN